MGNQRYSFTKSKDAWTALPVDDVGYIPLKHLLGLNDTELRRIVLDMERTRFYGWRNEGNKWRDLLGLDEPWGRVIDFGCGVGLDALQFASSGNEVVLADINKGSLKVAERTLALEGYKPVQKIEVSGIPPFLGHVMPYNLFYSAGVLHHTPKMPEILARAVRSLMPAGQFRLLLYSDRARARYISDQEFIKAMDTVGFYADWYSREKFEAAVPFLTVTRCEYIGQDLFIAIQAIVK